MINSKKKVALVGIGFAGFDSITPSLSYKELMFEAASKAYVDANINPRKDVQSFVCCTEDFWEGNSISDEYMPDQLGAAQRPLCTISSDGLLGLATGYMQIATGMAEVVVVEAHSKASDVITRNEIQTFAYDPVYHRSFKTSPYIFGGLEMNRFLMESGTTKEQCASVVVKNRKNGLLNPRGVYGAELTIKDVLRSRPICEPLNELDISQPIDGALVLVMASSKKAKRLTDNPIWVEGIGWATGTPLTSTKIFAQADYCILSSKMAYKMANIENPLKILDFVEIDDTFSYKELQHLEALGIYKKGTAGKFTEMGNTQLKGVFPVNPSGGSLGFGHLLEATGFMKAAEIMLQLREMAGPYQVKGARKALAQSWRGIPTASGVTLILGCGA